jgi:serine/threonine protein kinase
MVPRQYSYFLNPDLSGLGDSFDEKNSEENHSDLERQLVYLTLHVRDDGKPRYALKTLRGDLEKHKKNIASMDLACEAKFLLALPHLNIIQVRAIVGHVGKPNHFGIVMDRLLGTLGENIVKWKEAVNPHSKILDRACWRRVRHVSKRPRCVQSIWSKVTCKQQPRPPHDDGLFSERISALSDVARAMSFVHSKRILFRDLKPQNVGITVEGVYVIFDFGLAKELKVVDLVEEPDRYEATGLTGSRIFMAPEVATCQPYGFASDVFSFSMLMWEVIALDEVYQHMSVNEHFEKVILGGLRPKSLRRELPQSLNVMMELSWATDPRERPTFGAILRTLETSCESKDDDQCIFWSE